MSIRYILTTLRLNKQFIIKCATYPKYTIYLIVGKIIHMLLGLILLLYPMASKTWLKNALSVLKFNFWDIFCIYVDIYCIFARFLQILLFLSSPSNVKIPTAIIWWSLQQKSQKFEKVRLWTSNFRCTDLKDYGINRQWII